MHHTSIRISDELYELVEASGRPISEVVRDALASYFGVELTDEGKKLLLDLVNELIEERLEEHVQEYSHVRDIDLQLSESESVNVARALEVIKDWHRQGKEPTVAQVADEVGVGSRALGRLLKEQGIKTKLTKRGKKAGRYILLGTV